MNNPAIDPAANPLVWAGLLALVAALVWLFRAFWQVIGIVAAYKAKVLSTALFTCARDFDTGADDVAADAYRAFRLFRTRIDRQAATVTVSLLGLRPQTAIWRPGLGSTLTAGRQARPARVAERPRRARADWTVDTTPPALADAVARAFTEPNAARRRRTRAVVVAHGGRIVAERYAPGFGPDARFPGWSATKSVVPALVGVLVGDGRLSLADRELMPHWRGADPRAEISVDDLLRMRSGLRFREVYTSPRSDVLPMLYLEPDTAAFAASQPLVAAPGTVWSYSSGSTNILSAIIRRVVGESDYHAWPYRVLFDRIGMASALLEPDASGTFVCSSYMLATARDWLRFGQLHVQDGVWNGERLLPDGWVRRCTTPTPQSPAANYGAHWWLKLNPEIGGGSRAAARLPADAFFAVGHEGQTITVIPSLDLVAVRFGLSVYIDAWNQAEFVADIADAVG